MEKFSSGMRTAASGRSAMVDLALARVPQTNPKETYVTLECGRPAVRSTRMTISTPRGASHFASGSTKSLRDCDEFETSGFIPPSGAVG
jgi:hypothetical protein